MNKLVIGINEILIRTNELLFHNTLLPSSFCIVITVRKWVIIIIYTLQWPPARQARRPPIRRHMYKQC